MHQRCHISLLPAFSLSVVLFGSALAIEPDVTREDLPRFPALNPEQALAAFQLTSGVRIELAACEPNVVDPVAMAFDEAGALYVVEMRDYSERRAEKLSRVRRLEDRDANGVFESSSVFLDGLAWATGVACWDGGVFVIASPDIMFAKDTNGDGIADEQRVVFTGFGAGREKLNVQALPNSLTWGPDCRLHGATAANGGRIQRIVAGQPTGGAINVDGADFSFDPRTLEFRAETGTAQFGMTFDAFGRKFVCSNSAHIQWTAYERRYADKAAHLPLPAPLIDIPIDGPAAEVFRISPEEPWRVVRTHWRASGLVKGPVEGGGRASGYFTSACGVHVSKGSVYPGDIFICDVGSNLIHRKTVRESSDGPVAERAATERKSEFLASPDTWFRPIAFADGPDGALYIADMYREIVEHPDSLPPQIKKHLDLNSGNDRGRIWRVIPQNGTRHPPEDLGKMRNDQLVALLTHKNGWHRETAQRLLRQRIDSSAAPLLRACKTSPALQLLDGIGALTPADVVSALNSDDEPLQLCALRLAERFATDPAIAQSIRVLTNDSSPRVHWQLALTLRKMEMPDRLWILADMILKTGPVLESRLFKLRLSALRNSREAEEIFTLCQPDKALDAMRFAMVLQLDPASAPLQELRKTARLWLQSTTSDASQRQTALDLLASHASAAERELIRTTALDPAQSDAVRIRALSHEGRAAVPLLARWSELPATLRHEAIERLVAFAEGAKALLDAIADQRVAASELAAAQAARLRSHPEASVREAAKKLLGTPPADRGNVVAAALPALKLQASATRGHDIFLQRCATCHRDGGEGAMVGPERATFRNQGKPTLLVAILDPNREVAPQFFTTNILTNEGESLAGVLAHEDGATVTLRLAGGQERGVPREKIERIERLSRSIMPEGVEAGLDDQGLADLLEFLIR